MGPSLRGFKSEECHRGVLERNGNKFFDWFYMELQFDSFFSFRIFVLYLWWVGGKKCHKRSQKDDQMVPKVDQVLQSKLVSGKTSRRTLRACGEIASGILPRFEVFELLLHGLLCHSHQLRAGL